MSDSSNHRKRNKQEDGYWKREGAFGCRPKHAAPAANNPGKKNPPALRQGRTRKIEGHIPFLNKVEKVRLKTGGKGKVLNARHASDASGETGRGQCRPKKKTRTYKGHRIEHASL